MEGKQRLLQLIAFTNGPAIDVVQQYFEFKIIRQGTDFEDYLNDPQNKHKLFHERYPKIPCCECLRTTSIAAPLKRGCLGYQQFSKLYDENGTVTAGHEQTNRSKISQRCICKVSAQKSIKVIDIDLTLLNAIIQHCCNLHITKKIGQWMKVIKEVRNTVSHWPAGQLEKNMFDQTWKKLEKATLQCAGDIGHTSVKMFQMTIDSITTFSVDQLEKRILQTTDNLSKVHEDLNGIIPTVKSVLSKQNELGDQLCSQSKDLTEVKHLLSGVNSVVEQTKDVMENVNIKTEESTNDFAMIKEGIGDVKHMLKQLGFEIGMTLKRQGEIHEDSATGKRKRSVRLDVEATSTDWDEEKTTLSLKDEMQTIKERVDNDHHDDTKEFKIEKVENKCIHLELSASPDVFGSPQKLRKAIKSLIDQFVKAAQLDGNVSATVNMNIIVKSALTTEEKKVAHTVFSDNDTLDGSDYNEQLKIEQMPRQFVKASSIEPDQQIASTSSSEIMYSRQKVKSFAGVTVKKERQEVAKEQISVHLENFKFNLQIEGLPHSLSLITEQDIPIEENFDFSVIWTWHYIQKKHIWDVDSIADTINSRISHLSDWFHVEYAGVDISGRLALQTTTASHTFSSLPSLEMAVQSFLGKFIEVCDLKQYLEEEQMIKLNVSSQFNENKGSADDICSSDDKIEDFDFEDSALIKRKKRTETSSEVPDKGSADDICSSDDKIEDLDFGKALKKLKMSTEIETEKESTNAESVTELQEHEIKKGKTLQKLGEIHSIGRETEKGQRGKKRQLVTTDDKRHEQDSGFLVRNLESLRYTMYRCQQCGFKDSDVMKCVCTTCKLIFCEGCMVKQTKIFPDHEYDCMRGYTTSGLEYHFMMSISNASSYNVIDMKSVKKIVVIITSDGINGLLRVNSTIKRNRSKSTVQLKLDTRKSQIAIIDEKNVAVTVPCNNFIHMVNFKDKTLTQINVKTNMTGAIAFIDSNLYVAFIENVLKMNLQGEEILSIDLPGIRFLHPVGQSKMYCLSNNPGQNISFLDITNNKEQELSNFPFHPDSITSDECSNIYFIFINAVWKAEHDGTDYKVVLTGADLDLSPTRVCFNISSNLLIVLCYGGYICIYRKVESNI